MADDKMFFSIFRIDGVPFTMRTLCPDLRQARIAVLSHIASRNANITTERGELVKIYEVGTDITPQQAFQMEADNKLRKEMDGLPAPEDIDPDFPNRILHEPITGTY